jgi:hypothetical protein
MAPGWAHRRHEQPRRRSGTKNAPSGRADGA